MPFQIIRNDITKVAADAIVNTANPEVAIGDGVDFAIYNAAGREKLLEERRKIGTLMPGEVAITDAFDLNAKYIIHASGPWWMGGNSGEKECLRTCYEKSLRLAKEHDCKSIAFPLLATGSYGFPKELGIQIAVDSFTAFLEENDMEITLVVFGNEDVKISGTLVEAVTSFIDDQYVETTLDEEYARDRGRLTQPNRGELTQPDRARSGRRTESAYHARVYDEPDYEDASDYEDESVSEKEPGFVKPALDEPPCRSVGAKKSSRMAIPKNFLGVNCAEAAPMKASPAISLEAALKEIYTESFEKHLQQLINKKGLKNSEVYARANISKQYFSKLLKGQVKPSKEKMLALAVGLCLNLDETIDFLRIAGYALSPISQTDKIVEYFIVHKDYSVMKIDIVLFDYGLDPLSNQ